MLENGEIAWALENVRKLPPGKYTVRKIFGLYWGSNRRPRDYGKRFNASVRHGDLPGVRWVRQRSDRSQEYEVLTIAT